MGAGVVRAQQDTDGNFIYSTGNGPRIVINSPRRPSSPQMVCEGCSSSFSVFRRKKRCRECERHFCADCIIRISESNDKRKSCQKCNILISGNFTKQDLQDWKVKDLRALLKKRNISMEACTEKHDLIDLLFLTFVLNKSNSSNIQHNRRENTTYSQSSHTSSESSHSGHPSTSQTMHATFTITPETNISSSTAQQSSTSQQSSTEQNSSTEQVPETEAQRAERLRQRQAQELAEAEARRRMQQVHEDSQEHPPQERVKRFAVTDINSEEEIENLTVKQLKEVLVNNFVDYKGCVEKAELQLRVKRLWKEHKANQQKANEIHKSSDNTATTTNPAAQPPPSNEEDLCKICLDHVIDCVLLECGHMVTCTQCGRRLAECPICRQHIVRVVHTFKS